MSTILKALRRLEEEEDAKVEAKATRVAADAGPEVAADLRERIFAEEAAAQALVSAPGPRSTSTAKIMIGVGAIAAILLIGFATNWYVESNPRRDANVVATASATDPGVAPRKAPAPAAPIARPAAERQRTAAPVAPSPVPTVAQKPSPNTADSAGGPTLVAIAKSQGPSAPTWPSGSAMAARSGNRPGMPSSPADRSSPPGAESTAPALVDGIAGARVARATAASPSRAEGPTPRASAAKPKVVPLAVAAVRPTPAASSSRKSARSISSLPEAAESTSAATASSAESISRPTNRHDTRPHEVVESSPAAKVAAAPPPLLAESRALPAAEVHRIDHRGLPDVVVMRTAWHPKPERRSAKIRLVASDETLNLKEGDAVGGMVVQEITPSTVLFAAGEVEIRRKVGATR